MVTSSRCNPVRTKPPQLANHYQRIYDCGGLSVDALLADLQLVDYYIMLNLKSSIIPHKSVLPVGLYVSGILLQLCLHAHHKSEGCTCTYVVDHDPPVLLNEYR